jgi:hypothetical protein
LLSGWLKGLEVTAGGAGIVSHAGLALLRTLSDGAEVINDFRVMTDQAGLFGLAASVPTAWRTLSEIASDRSRMQARITRAVSAARRPAWAAIWRPGLPAPHRRLLPGIRQRACAVLDPGSSRDAADRPAARRPRL